MKHIFFIGSFGSIYRRALPLIDQKSKEGEVLVVTSNDNAYKFFKNYTPFEIIKTNVNPNLITIKTFYKFFSNIIRSKVEYKKLFKRIKGAHIYFFNTNNTLVTFSYLQKLSKHNQLHFYSSEPDKLNKQIKPTILNNWFAYFIEAIIKITLNLNIRVRMDAGKMSLCVYKDFFRKNKVKDIYEEFDPSIYKKYMKKTNLEGKKILVLWSDLVGEGRMTEEAMTNQSNQLIHLLDKYYPNQYIIKAHPNMNMLYGKMVNAPQLDSYVPSQFFMYHPWKIVIADCSAALVFPEEQGLMRTLLIEMVDVLEFKDEQTRKEIKEFLLKWNRNLVCPKTFEELEEIVK